MLLDGAVKSDEHGRSQLLASYIHCRRMTPTTVLMPISIRERSETIITAREAYNPLSAVAMEIVMGSSNYKV